MKTFYDALQLTPEATQEDINAVYESKRIGEQSEEFIDAYFFLCDEVNNRDYKRLISEESSTVVEEFHHFLRLESDEIDAKYSDDVAKSDAIVHKCTSLLEKLTSPMAYLLFFLGEAHWKRDEDELSQSYFKRYNELYPGDSEVQEYCENRSMANPEEKQENEEYLNGEIKRRSKAYDLIILLAQHHFNYREYKKGESLLDSEIANTELNSANSTKWFSLSAARASFYFKRGDSAKGNEALGELYNKAKSLDPFPAKAVAEVIAFLKRECDEEWEEKFKELYEMSTFSKRKNSVMAISLTIALLVLTMLISIMK